MHEYSNNLIEYIKWQIVEFQNKNGNIPEEDINAIISLLEISIKSMIESESGYHLKITDIIEETINNSKNVVDVPSSNMIDALYEVKKNIKCNSIIKKSPLLTSLSKGDKESKERLHKNIPAIDCIITEDKIIIEGYSKEGSEITYEVHKGDRYVTKKTIEYISMQEALNAYSSSNKNIK